MSIAGFTQPEGLDSPLTSDFSTESRRPGGTWIVPHGCCSANHLSPRYHGLISCAPVTTYWPTTICHVCNVGAALPSFVPQSGIFPTGEYYNNVVVIPEFIYPDGSLIIDAINEVNQKRLDYILYYTNGDFSLPLPDSDFYASALNTAKRFLKNYSGPNKPQSGLMFQSGTLVTETLEKHSTQILTSFLSDTRSEEVSFDVNHEQTLYSHDLDVEQLQHFLSRPLNILNYVITPGATAAPLNPLALPSQIQPSLFFQNKRVMNRMNNYRNFKCDLCFKFLINGSPFHYGRYIAATLPNHTEDALFGLPNLTVDNGPLIRSRLTQLPHVYLNPTTSQGGCLRLPYLHKFDAFNMALSEQNNIGVVILSELVPLLQLGTAVDTITIAVYCWAENVVFGAPTTNNLPGLVPQSSDEYEELGPISSVSNTIMKASAILEGVPMISKYARISTLILKFSTNVAYLLGFSRPNVISDMMIVRERKNPNYASTNQKDPIYKVTLDDKQEVSIDPRIVGFNGRDNMLISDIIQRSCIYHVFPWRTTSAPGVPLIYMNVAPNFWGIGSGAGANRLALTPLTYVAQSFRYWRGSLRFRFVAVASSFHRGRVRLIYDPAGFGTVTGTTVFESNTNYNYIWDLSDSHEATMDVCFMSHLPYCRTQRPGALNVKQGFAGIYGGANGLSHSPSTDNGSIALVVQNDLTCSGQAVSDVQIMCYVSAGPDFEFFEPEDGMNDYSFYPQSGEMMQDDLHLRSASPDVVFGKYISPDNQAHNICHGDPVISIRALLKRYCTYFYVPMPALPAGVSVLNWNLSGYPLNRGKAPNGMHLAGTASTNYVHNTHITWFSALFMAKRGGMRWRVTDVGSPTVKVTHLQLTRTPNSTFAANIGAAPVGTSTGAVAKAYLSAFTLGSVQARNSIAGFTLGENTGNGKVVADIELPYYNNRRFIPCRTGDNSIPSDMGLLISAIVGNGGTVPQTGALNCSIAGADDYSLYGFIGVPIVHYVPVLT
jgi:hypothetical protein